MTRAEEIAPPNAPPKSGKPIVKLVVLAAVVGLACFLCREFGSSLELATLANHETRLRDFQAANPVFVMGVAFVIYVTITGLSLPGALIATLVVGWFFGFWRGVLLVSFASTAGATIAFLLSRFLLRESIQAKFGDRLRTFNAALEREGAFYLFTLRLIPVPYVVINLVMGLTPIRTRTYWWVSQVGMLPGTMAYVFAGSEFPSLQKLADNGVNGLVSPGLVAAFVVLGCLPFVIKKFLPGTKV